MYRGITIRRKVQSKGGDITLTLAAIEAGAYSSSPVLARKEVVSACRLA